jgi:23S rRNA pseudouridine1911/1915/1917 synthase
MELKANKNGIRLDVFLQKELNFTRSNVKKLIENGNVRVNGNKVKPAKLIKIDETIEIDEIKKQESSVLPEKIPLDIVYEDDGLIVINKPAGMITHPAPTSKIYSGTLVNALLNHTNELSNIGAPFRPGIVHRLDKDTSGLLIVAKNDFTHLALTKQLKDKTLHRIYIVVVKGEFKENQGEVNAPVGRHPKDRKKQAVTLKGSKKALTYYKVLERFNGYTLLEAKLSTGRTHQIRVHMSYIKHPVIGDNVYGSKKEQNIPINRQALHSQKISFVHPKTQKLLEFESKIPDDINKLISYLKKI